MALQLLQTIQSAAMQAVGAMTLLQPWLSTASKRNLVQKDRHHLRENAGACLETGTNACRYSVNYWDCLHFSLSGTNKAAQNLNNRTSQQPPPPHSSVKLACSSKHNSVVDGSQPSVVTKSPAVSHRPASVLQGPPFPCNAALGAVIVNSVLSNREKQRKCHIGISWYKKV